MTRRLGIVGAGAAGLGAAYALREADVETTLLEKSGGVCGRAATRRRNGCRYDHGANYVKPDDEGRTNELVRSLGEDGLVDVEQPVHVFDGEGSVSEGDDDRADEHKWTWEAGITQFGKRVLDRTDAELRLETRVESLERTDDEAGDGGWRLRTEAGDAHGEFDAVLLTPPAPQTAALLSSTKWESPGLETLREAVGSVPFRTVRTLVLHYPFELDRPYYGLVNVDGDHDVGWCSREECKRGHVPDGESLLIAQMGADWSEEHYDDPLEEAVADAAPKVADLLDDERLTDPDWTDDQGWRYSQPNDGVDRELVREGEGDGLFFAGDWVAGEGRVHRAFWNGHEVGERIADGG